MAVLVDADRVGAWSDYQKEMSDLAESCGITKIDLRAAIDAADDWIDANAVAYNSALPVPARTTLTAKQKARLLVYVISRRYKVT